MLMLHIHKNGFRGVTGSNWAVRGAAIIGV